MRLSRSLLSYEKVGNSSLKPPLCELQGWFMRRGLKSRRLKVDPGLQTQYKPVVLQVSNKSVSAPVARNGPANRWCMTWSVSNFLSCTQHFDTKGFQGRKKGCSVY